MRRDPLMQGRAQGLRAAQTAAERRLWSLLRARRLAGLKFRRQQVLGQYIADFVCIPARLVIEVDGETHGAEFEAHDATRTEAIERAGYKVIRFWNNYVLGDTEAGVTQVILEAIRTSALPAAEKARLEAGGYFDPPACLHPSP
jgi:very-short-patch-repair endonuclease